MLSTFYGTVCVAALLFVFCIFLFFVFLAIILHYHIWCPHNHHLAGYQP